MSKSLQDQLLALGLAGEKPEKNRNPARPIPAKADQRLGVGGSPKKVWGREKQAAGGEVSLDRAYALRKQEEKKQADTARKRKQAEDRQRRRLNQEIRAIVSTHRLNDSQAEIPRHFMYRGRIRKINLTPDQLKALNAGELGIAYLSGGYHLLAPEHLQAVQRLSAEHVADLAAGNFEEPEEFPVPDDLTW
ncbi:MAG: DUF2058 family protein [Xanthomonadales bacterium]